MADMNAFECLGRRTHARNAALVAVGGALAASVWCWPLTAAYADATSAYGEWTMNGSTGQVSIPLAGFPAASVTTDSSTSSVQSGTSAFLGPGTPVGARYGTSQGRTYVNLRTAAGRTPSTTTLTFESPTNAGTFAFTLGDIDADSVRVSATGADGQPLTAAELGWQGAFNYCQSSPKPSSCGPTGTDTDQPVWDPATSTLIGNGADTTGAAGWFQPTVPVTSITLTFSMQSGFPIYQLWTSSLSSQIAGRLASDCGTPSGQEVRLLDENGAPVLNPDGTPVTTTTDAQGNYAFADIAPGQYQVSTTSADYTPQTNSLPADTSDGNSVTNADLTLTCQTSPSPTPTDTDSPTPTSTDTDSPTPTPTDTASPSPTDTASPTPTETGSPTPTDTASPTPTDTASPTPTDPGSPSPTDTASPSPTDSASPSPTGTSSPTPTDTASPTPTGTGSPTPTGTGSPSPTGPGSPSPTGTGNPSPTGPGAPTPTGTGSATPTPTPTGTCSAEAPPAYGDPWEPTACPGVTTTQPRPPVSDDTPADGQPPQLADTGVDGYAAWAAGLAAVSMAATGGFVVLRRKTAGGEHR
ncbi:hypothetical protein DMT42_00930 [Streptomyces actuosus]|uniref:SD-repeat containing protein B domain-containing protein n=3 Tax=Streptomyces TaxID=1883 RepID=A0A2U9NW26_STRAS|nr:hypothetical protein DMT42_00930 [Streptomyces actuosus]